MFSWLNTNSSKNEQTPNKNNNHLILKTPLNHPLTNDQDEILFGCGCFWGAEKGFWKLPGVITTSVGYAGGQLENPNYNQVCSGKTGHAEVVRVVWNKSKIDLSDLLKLFWECHDPTQGNRQGNDHGTQYRSAIYCKNNDQLNLAKDSRDAYQEVLSKQNFGAITTEIKSYQTFYIAENYHQQYLARPGSRPYCSAMPTKIKLNDFPNSNFILDKQVWSEYNWEVNHCVLRSDNNPIAK